MKRRHLIILAVCVSLCAAMLFFVSTGLIRGWGKWYSQSLIYRNQTEAFLSGRVYLSDNPKEMTYDHIFFNGKIQQVWGLGAPALRLPFELGARLFGFESFPDRLVLGFYFWLVALIVFFSAYASAKKAKLGQAGQMFSAVVLTLIVAMLPVVVALGRTRFVVYEEAIMYGYLVSIIMLAVTPLVSEKQPKLLLLFAFFCGLSGFFRPTVLIYGAISVLILIILSKSLKYKIGIATVFFIGCVLLGASNYSRFGNFFAFGHSINVDADPVNVYQLKFSYPFARAPILSAAEELFGVLFLDPKFNDKASLYKEKAFTHQAEIFRWRNLYSKTFSLRELAIVLIAFCLACWFLLRHNLSAGARQFLKCDFLAWSLPPFALLFGFYLYSPSICSRYMTDFAASIVGMIFAIFFFVASQRAVWKKYSALAIILVCVLSMIRADYSGKRKISSQALTWEELAARRAPKTKKHIAIGSRYALNEDFGQYGIFTNGTGWDTKTGAFRSSVLVFARNMNYLKLDFSASSTISDLEFFKEIEIKIGNERIRPMFVRPKEDGVGVFFVLPEKYRNTSYAWPVFIKMLPESRLAETETEMPLTSIEWHSN